jgi:hypothetical protein
MTLDELREAVDLVSDLTRLRSLREAANANPSGAVLEVKPSGAPPAIRENIPVTVVRTILNDRMAAVAQRLTQLGVVVP